MSVGRTRSRSSLRPDFRDAFDELEEVNLHPWMNGSEICSNISRMSILPYRVAAMNDSTTDSTPVVTVAAVR